MPKLPATYLPPSGIKDNRHVRKAEATIDHYRLDPKSWGGIQEAITRAAMDAVKCLHDVIKDKTAPYGPRVEASRIVLDRAGHSGNVVNRLLLKEFSCADDKPLAEMSSDELQAQIVLLEGVAKAKGIETSVIEGEKAPISDADIDSLFS